MEHRTGTNDAANGPSSSSASMPNVLFREIHKNAFLKRHSSDRRTGFPRKSERVWVVFCVHDDVEPFLEIYPDQKLALTHKPDWFASLSTALHVSPTICGHEDEFEFAITLSFQVVRLAAPSWESMMEWVETIRNKLRELKVLCPKENVYSKMPEPKQQLLPTRDPNSPLPLPPEGPSTLLPGVEIVHLQSRNGSSSSDNGDSTRQQRDQREGRHNRNIQERHGNKRQRDKRPQAQESITTSPDVASASTSNGHPQMDNLTAQKQQAPTIPALLKNKSVIQKQVSIPQQSNCSPQISTGSNVTVIEVSLPTSTQSTCETVMDSRVGSNGTSCDVDDVDDVFHGPSTSHKAETRVTGTNSSHEEEAHYEHVFLLNIPVAKSQNLKCVEPVLSKTTKPHSTSVLINSNLSIPVSSSPSENVPSSSRSSVPVTDVHVAPSPTTFETGNGDKRDSVVAIQIQTNFDKVNISGSAVSKTSTRLVHSKGKTPYGSEVKSLEGSAHHQHGVIVEEEEEDEGGEETKRRENAAAEATEGTDIPVYSQVKKIAKVKSKTSEPKNSPLPGNSSPVLPRRRPNGLATTETDPENSTEVVVKPGKSCAKVTQPMQRVAGGNKTPGPVNVTVVKDSARAHISHPCSSSGATEVVASIPVPGPEMTANAKAVVVKKEVQSNGNNKAEVEPMTATIPPAVGVITVEDIPLIGGHQRRRRRSSSSEAVPPPVVVPSRVIGGADRIRINVPQINQLGREEHRGEAESGLNSRSPVTDQIVQINVTPQSSRLTLREQQVFQLRKEMLHPGGVRLQLRRRDCTGSIALVDIHNGVWVAGWKQKEHPLLYNALHIGDQLISVSDMVIRTAADAHKLIRSSTNFHIEFIIRRVPYGNVFALQRTAEGQALGIVQEGNTAEIREVLPNSLAARQGLTSKTPSSDGLSLTTWFITEINGRPLNLFFKDSEVRDRLNAVGKEISILVQPHDFVKQLKKQLKNVRGYKDYIVQ